MGALLGGDVEYVLVTTAGDRDQISDLHAIGGTGVFTKEVQQAVLADAADIAVHSAKDLPAATPSGLTLSAIPERADPRDALVGCRFDELPPGARIGTDSVRRRAQLASARPDLTFGPLRGNIATRLRKRVDMGYDAVVVAYAALERLDLAREATEVLDPAVMIPQVAAGSARGRVSRRRLADRDAARRHRRPGRAPRGDGRARVPRRAGRRVQRAVWRARGRAGGRRAAPGRAARVARRAHRPPHGILRCPTRSAGSRGRRAVAARLPGRARVVTVYLVGAGPGDPGLLTRRGEQLLRAADVVVYDRLVSPALLALAPDSAERIDVGKAPGRAAMRQDEVNAVLVACGRAGKAVVRLKGGDPFVFGRGGEEAGALATAGIPFEVVPGVTSAIAAPAYAGIPVTHRGVSTHFTVVTGHEDPAKDGPDTDWDALARAGGTLVILMGAGRLAEITKALIAGGRDADTPVAAVRWGTLTRQRTTRATLATIADLGVEPPSAIVVGDVARLDFRWFEGAPLFGRTIVVTRAREQASGLRTRLEQLGAEVVELPAITIAPVEFALPDLTQYQWLVVTSANGVDAFFTRGLAHKGRDARALASVRVAAIGPRTADALRRRGIEPDLVPEHFVAESLVEQFPAGAGRVLLARAEVARDVLPDGLAAKGYEVEVVPVYRTVTATPDASALARVREGVDAITFTSSSTVSNFVEAVGAFPDPQPLVVSIGPVTSDTARARGLRVDAEAEQHTIDGLVTVLLEALRR